MKTWKIRRSYPSGEVRETQIDAETKAKAGQKFFRRKDGAAMLDEGKVEIKIVEQIDTLSAEDYTREILIGLCEDGFPPMDHWYDRDSYGAMKQLGVALALLKCDVPFRIEKCDAKVVWVDFYDIKGFTHYESREHEGDQFYDTETAYIPTRHRLEEAEGKGWY